MRDGYDGRRKSFSEMVTQAASAEFTIPNDSKRDHHTSSSSGASGIDFHKSHASVKPFLLDNVPESFLNEHQNDELSIPSVEVDLNPENIPDAQKENDDVDANKNDDDSSSVPFSDKSIELMEADSDDSSAPFHPTH